MLDNAKRMVASLTSLGIALLGLGIVASLLSPTGRIPWLGDIAGNIIGLINNLGSQGIVGLVALGVILYLFRD